MAVLSAGAWFPGGRPGESLLFAAQTGEKLPVWVSLVKPSCSHICKEMGEGRRPVGGRGAAGLWVGGPGGRGSGPAACTLKGWWGTWGSWSWHPLSLPAGVVFLVGSWHHCHSCGDLRHPTGPRATWLPASFHPAQEVTFRAAQGCLPGKVSVTRGWGAGETRSQAVFWSALSLDSVLVSIYF